METTTIRMSAGLAVIYVVWGATYPALRVVVETVPPWLGAAARFWAAAALLLGGLAVLQRGPGGLRITRREAAGCAVAGVLLMTCTQGLVALSLQHVPSGAVALVAASVPLWVVLLRRAGGERVPGPTLAGVGVGITGVAVLLLPGVRGDAIALGWLLVVALAGLCWAVGSYVQRWLPRPGDPLVAAGWQLAFGGAGASIIAVFGGEPGRFDPGAVTVASAAGLAFLVTAGSIVALGTYTWLLRVAPISTVATHAYVNPVVAVVLGGVLLGERMTVGTAVAAVVILGAVAWVVAPRASGTVAASPPPASPPAASASSSPPRSWARSWRASTRP